MKILLNNREEIFQANQLTVNELLAEKKFSFRMLLVKINGDFIKKEHYDSAKIKDGDEVAVLHLMSGG